jgi:multicomponent Na+:H+ antiporter subunit A
MAGGTRGAAGAGATAVTAVGVAVALLSVWLVASELPALAGGSVRDIAWPWLPGLGASLAFRLDGLSALFVLLIGSIGAMVFVYAHRYLGGHPHATRAKLLLLAFMVSMLGLVLADDALLLFVFWELTTVTSYLLIGFGHEDPRARRAALQALLVTGGGGLFLLVGLLLLGLDAGGLRISGWTAAAVPADSLRTPILCLVLIGAFTKSAQVPFHFWLPNAMVAPTPVSAYLHSATMVKAGVYLLARLHPVLGASELWFLALTTAGGATASWGALQALRQDDLKLALAYTTLATLGSIVLFLGSEVTIAVTAAVAMLLVHALYKSSLFLVVGIVEHATGTRDASRLAGLARAMPWTAGAAALAALSMAGFPPFLGFVGKELKYEGALAIADEPSWLAATLVLANALLFAVSCQVAFRPFWGPRVEAPRPPHEVPRRMLLGPALLASGGLVLGLSPELVGRLLVEPAVAAIRDRPSPVELALWHGLNVALAMSLATAALGLALYRGRAPLRAGLARAAAALPLSGDRAWDAALAGLQALANGSTARLQSGSLSRYLATTFATVVLLVGGTQLVRGSPLAWPAHLEPIPPHAWAITALIVAAALLAARTRSRLAAIAALGVVGVGAALLFLLFGAPDVAMTQLLVETLFVVIVASALLRMPRLADDLRSRATRARDAVLAAATGATVTAVLLAVLAVPFDPFVGDWFLDQSVPAGFGRNVVNVILVDFRALDTLGEITVVVAAGWAVHALLGLRGPREGGT